MMSCDKLKPKVGQDFLLCDKNVCLAEEDTFYHDYYVSRCCNTHIYRLTAREILRHATSFLAVFLPCIIGNSS